MAIQKIDQRNGLFQRVCARERAYNKGGGRTRYFVCVSGWVDKAVCNTATDTV